jgi:hypothetical protein
MLLYWAPFVTATVYILRQRERRGLALGLVCPRRGKSLYMGRNSGLTASGECPRCKAFISEELHEKFDDSPSRS